MCVNKICTVTSAVIPPSATYVGFLHDYTDNSFSFFAHSYPHYFCVIFKFLLPYSQLSLLEVVTWIALHIHANHILLLVIFGMSSQHNYLTFHKQTYFFSVASKSC